MSYINYVRAPVDTGLTLRAGKVIGVEWCEGEVELDIRNKAMVDGAEELAKRARDLADSKPGNRESAREPGPHVSKPARQSKMMLTMMIDIHNSGIEERHWGRMGA
jgi:hypothetical protein